MNNKLCCTLLMLSLVLPTPALADKWVELGTIGEVAHFINTESLVKEGRFVEAQWKTRSSTNEVAYHGTVDCEHWELNPNRAMDTDLGSGKSLPLPRNRLRSLYPSFPGSTSVPEVEFVCARIEPEQIAKMTALPDKGCAPPMIAPVKELCTYGAEFRANSYLFWRRTKLTRYACGDSEEDFLEAAMEVFRQRNSCKDQKCRNDVDGTSMDLITKDLETAHQWNLQNNAFPMPRGSCQFVPTLQKLAKERARFSNEYGIFRKCIIRQAERLDDRRTGAEVVAKVLQNACKSEFLSAMEAGGIDSPAAQDQARKRFETEVLEILLEYRATRRKKE